MPSLSLTIGCFSRQLTPSWSRRVVLPLNHEHLEMVRTPLLGYSSLGSWYLQMKFQVLLEFLGILGGVLRAKV
ncbi:hypothetical protein EJ03DRAFT_326417 [Teratosphaeria nubilosa]|uniref:Uncharacterized protein n=1 Tax=Teratosphaeria nubilosa TaxID=161662 RepID=A0A6G1LED3_9PEZI|nr:hypothetical protein EJ03DRAFT_326417 [Teratosphaeria nubilosa]